MSSLLQSVTQDCITVHLSCCIDDLFEIGHSPLGDQTSRSLTAVSLLMVLVDPTLRLACFNKSHHVAEVCLRLMTTGGHVTHSLDLFNCLLTEMSNQSIS